jgi:hypothetical protein
LQVAEQVEAGTVVVVAPADTDHQHWENPQAAA